MLQDFMLNADVQIQIKMTLWNTSIRASMQFRPSHVPTSSLQVSVLFCLCIDTGWHRRRSSSQPHHTSSELLPRHFYQGLVHRQQCTVSSVPCRRSSMATRTGRGLNPSLLEDSRQSSVIAQRYRRTTEMFRELFQRDKSSCQNHSPRSIARWRASLCESDQEVYASAVESRDHGPFVLFHCHESTSRSCQPVTQPRDTQVEICRPQTPPGSSTASTQTVAVQEASLQQPQHKPSSTHTLSASKWRTAATFSACIWLPWSTTHWIGLSSPHQHSIGYMGDGFYRSKDPTNSIKVLTRITEKYNKHTYKHKTQQIP